MSDQGQLFEHQARERSARAEEPESVLVPRPPGWSLIANRAGPNGFHQVKAVGQLGAVITRCGVTGRKITESEQRIVLCPACREVASS